MPDAYRLIHEMSYPDAGGTEHTYPAGSVREDIPPDDIGWLVEQGHIERAGAAPEPAAPGPNPVAEAPENPPVTEA